MPFLPGNRANPLGAPKRGNRLTTMLLGQLDRMLRYRGKEVSAKELMAQLVIETVMTGRIPVLPEPYNAISAREWIQLVQWIYTYTEPPVTRLANADDTPLTISVTLADPSELIDPPTRPDPLDTE